MTIIIIDCIRVLSHTQTSIYQIFRVGAMDISSGISHVFVDFMVWFCIRNGLKYSIHRTSQQMWSIREPHRYYNYMWMRNLPLHFWFLTSSVLAFYSVYNCMSMCLCRIFRNPKIYMKLCELCRNNTVLLRFANCRPLSSLTHSLARSLELSSP